MGLTMASKTFTVDSGTLVGSATNTVVLNGTIGWTGGLLEGTLTLASNSTLTVAGTKVRDLASRFRRIWAQGQAGVEVPITVYRDGETVDLRVKSSERDRFLKGPSLH